MRRFLIILLILPLFTAPCHAENDLITEVTEAIPEAEKEVRGMIRDDGTYDAAGVLSRLWDRFLETIRTEIRNELSIGAGMVAIGLAVSLAASFTGRSGVSTYLNTVGVCAVSALLLGGMDSLVSSTTDTLYRLSDYSRAAIPAIFTAAAAGGAAVSAPVKYAAVCVALDLLMALSNRIVIPLVYSYLALSVSGGLFDNSILRCCKSVVKWCITKSMTALTLGFTAFIGVSGVITGSADALAVKTARTVISSALPVIGGLISDAASTVLSAAAIIKNSAGTIAMLAVGTMCVEPFARLLVRSLIFKAGAAICDSTPGLRVSAVIADIATAVNFLMGLVGSTSIILFISLTSAIRTVNV